MKTLITALAVTAILATSAAAKTQRAAHIQSNHVVSHNSVSRNPVAQLSASYCRFHDGEKDPDSKVRLYMLRDCREHDNGDE
jgi:hypothetical protein